MLQCGKTGALSGFLAEKLKITGLLRPKGGWAKTNLTTYQTTNTFPVVLRIAIATWVHVGVTQAQVVAIEVRARSRRPIAAARPYTVDRRRTEASRVEEVIWVASK